MGVANDDGDRAPDLLLVWIDQDLCAGDGLCVDHCPEVPGPPSLVTRGQGQAETRSRVDRLSSETTDLRPAPRRTKCVATVYQGVYRG